MKSSLQALLLLLFMQVKKYAVHRNICLFSRSTVVAGFRGEIRCLAALFRSGSSTAHDSQNAPHDPTLQFWVFINVEMVDAL